MQIVADTHTHSIISGDAHSTIYENIMAAKARGLKFLCLTDHVNSVPRAAAPEYFISLCSLPREFEGVRLLRGCEVNITDYEGHLDMPEKTLDWLDVVVASLHDVVIKPSSKADHTQCWLAVADNPHVDIIGHCGDPRFSFDLNTVIPVFGKKGKIVEINNHSFTGLRTGSKEVCKQVALACMQYDVPIVVSSDAHFMGSVGVFDHALAMLQSINFPEELILNADEKRFAAFVSSRHGSSEKA